MAISADCSPIRAMTWINVAYRDKTKTFQVAPCRLIPYLGRLYVAAWTETHKSYLTLAVDRIRSVADTPDAPTTFPDFTIDAFMANRFGLWSSEEVDDVIVHIHPDAYEQFATRRWHPSQKLTDLPNGGLEIRMRTGIGHELTSWVLHWAPLITVIAPQRLKDEIKKKVKEME
ncbi:MAG: WYL domain-containing protein [Candidatus Kapabacteria bacterium]|nr:WYL domain-containing protein [Candidatus Kapabacteria bacterium]